MQTDELNNLIVTHYAGSIAYGTNLPTSDTDIRGIFCAEEKSIRTPFFSVNEVVLEEEEDGKVYELSKFMKLYTDCNPNIVESLWVDDRHIITSSPVYDYLKSHREDLLSSKVAFTFSGYALSQLKRIKGHNKWLNNPQTEQTPKHKDYLKLVQNFSNEKVFSRDFTKDCYSILSSSQMIHYGDNVFGIVEEGGTCCLCSEGDFNIGAKQATKDNMTTQPMYIVKYLQEEYKQAIERHKNYWIWVKNRNKIRATTEAKYGYDTKHAMHLVRLLRMAEEILKGEGVRVFRPDAQELLDIRKGCLSYDELISYAEERDRHIRGPLYRGTSLRKTPDIHLAARVLIDCQNMCWG